MNRALAVVLGAVAVTLTALVVPVRADVILTTSGGRIEGKIIEEKDSSIKVKTEKGTVVTIPRDEIDSITREKPDETYARKLKALKSDDVKGLLELAAWARDNKLPEKAADACERVVKSDPENFEARSALGYEKVSGKWLKGDELTKAKGLVEYQGRWITPEEKGLLEQGYQKRGDRWVSKEEAQCIDEGRPYRPGGDSAGNAPAVEKPEKASKPEGPAKVEPKSAAEPKPQPIELPADDKELMKIVLSTSKKPEERDAAVKALAAKGDSQKDALKQELAKLADAAKKSVTDYIKSEKAGIRAKMAALVIERRKAALAFIFDTAQYPDADHGKVGQPTVDKLVDELRLAWQDPLHELLRDKGEKKLHERMDELQRIALWMRDPVGVTFDMRKTEDELAQEANKLAGVSETGCGDADSQILETSKATLKWNATTKTSLATEERECILATNEYRMMFGLPALKAHEPLIQAARKHSQEMVDMKYFAHDSPVPENSSPGKRCQKEGARYTGENIAMGSTSGRTTFVQWYHSSGHHRNMLMRHKSMGVGNVGQTWTEDFGLDDPQ